MAPATRYMDAGTNVPPGNSLITGVGIHPILKEKPRKGTGKGGGRGAWGEGGGRGGRRETTSGSDGWRWWKGGGGVGGMAGCGGIGARQQVRRTREKLAQSWTREEWILQGNRALSTVSTRLCLQVAPGSVYR